MGFRFWLRPQEQEETSQHDSSSSLHHINICHLQNTCRTSFIALHPGDKEKRSKYTFTQGSIAPSRMVIAKLPQRTTMSTPGQPNAKPLTMMCPRHRRQSIPRSRMIHNGGIGAGENVDEQNKEEILQATRRCHHFGKDNRLTMPKVAFGGCNRANWRHP